MKEGITYKRLGDLVRIRTGKLDANAANEGGKYPFFTCAIEPLRINTYSYDCECVLIAGNGDLNVKYYNGKFDAYQRTYIIEKKEGVDYISVPYLYRFFELYIEELRQGSIGGIIKYIKLGNLTEARIPIPSLDIQQRIVRELDAINAIIADKKQQLAELDTLAQAIFYSMFGDPITNEKGWEVKKLGEVGQTTSGGTPSKNHPEYYNNGTIPWLRSGEVAKGLIYDTELFITQAGLDNSSAKIVPVNTVSIAMYGATVGEVGIIKKPMCTNQAICNILPCDEIEPFYLRFFLMGMKDKYINLAAGGAQPNISQAIIRDTKLPLPPLPLQQAFAAKIEAIEEQKTALRASLTEFESFLAQRLEHHFA